MKKELWKNVVGYEELYQISSMGRVKTIPRTVIDSLGRKQPIKEKIIRVCVCKHTGYPYVSLNKNGKSVKSFIHRLIAEAFIPNPQNLPCVNHKDEDRGNSVLENLEWCSYSYNNSYGDACKKRKETLRKSLVGKHKIIYQFTKRGELVRVFVHGISQMQEDLGYDIGDCLTGKSKTSHGYVFSYSADFSYVSDLPPKHQKIVYKIDNNGKIIRKYKSVSEAGRLNGFDRHSLSRITPIDGIVHVNGMMFIVEKKENEYIPKGHKGPRPDLKGKSAKPVCQYTKEGIFVKEYESIRTAANDIGYPSCTPEISNCCNGKLKTARGYIWRHKGDPAPSPFIDSTLRKIEQYTLDGKFINTFNSIQEAADKVGNGRPGSISNNLKGISHSAFGYIWKYAKE